jgi:hypothetical protein
VRQRVVDAKPHERRVLGLSFGVTTISLIAAPIAGVWCVISLWLDRKQIAFARKR